MNWLTAIKQEQLNLWVERAKQQAKIGKLPSYIPILKQVEPDELAVCIISLNRQILLVGESDRTFPLMSVIKPFLLLYLLSHLGSQTVFKRVGKNRLTIHSTL